MRTLIAEPSKTYRNIIRNILEADGLEPVFVENGKQAIESLKTDCPDIILVSHELGDIDSFEFIRHINNQGLCIDAPKFLITSNNSLEFRRKCYDIGYTEILLKSDIGVLQVSCRSMLQYKSCFIKANILYVEDVASTAAYTSNLMTNFGWNVDHVETAEEALDKVKQSDFDLLITDLILSGKLSGINLIEELRAGSTRERSLPILALSGWNDLLRQVYVLQRGASDFISKPFQENDFKARAINLIHNKRKNDQHDLTKNYLKHKAHTDALTTLCNRHCILEYSENLCKDSIETGVPLSLLIIDLDFFKNINDSFGHSQGDKVLHEVGGQLKFHARDTDLIGRWGGEEFLVILPHCDLEIAVERAEKLRMDIEALKPHKIPVTVSIGVSTLITEHNESFDQLLRRADKALYEAKESGRNKVVASNTSAEI
jgi:two-component system cell cycle response regulator